MAGMNTESGNASVCHGNAAQDIALLREWGDDTKDAMPDSKVGFKPSRDAILQDATLADSGKMLHEDHYTENLAALPSQLKSLGTAAEASLQSTMDQEKRKQANRTKLLQKNHARLTKVREEAESQERTLELEYDDLNLRANELEETQQELMNYLKEEVGGVVLTRDVTYLQTVWDRARKDTATFSARLSRIRQLEELLKESKERLFAAERDFVAAAEKAVARKQAKASTSFQDDLDAVLREEFPQLSEVSITAQAPQLSLLEKLQSRRADQQMYKERLTELEWEQDEDVFARELLLDRGDKPEMPEDDFMQSYLAARGQIEQDLEEVSNDIAQLEQQCRAQGLNTNADMTISIPFDVRTVYEPDLQPQNHFLDPLQPNPFSALARPIPFYDTNRLSNQSQTSTAESKNSMKRQKPSLDDWFATLPERPSSADGMLEQAVVSVDSSTVASTQDGTKRAPKSLV